MNRYTNHEYSLPPTALRHAMRSTQAVQAAEIELALKTSLSNNTERRHLEHEEPWDCRPQEEHHMHTHHYGGDHFINKRLRTWNVVRRMHPTCR